MRVDREADVVTLILSDVTNEDSAVIAGGIVVDFDVEGRIVGIEALGASRCAGDPLAVANMSFELPGAA